MMSKNYGILIPAMLLISACGTDRTESDDGSAAPSPETETADTASAKASESGDEAPVLSEFQTRDLHEAAPVAPGMFRLEIAGEVHENALDHCWISEGDIEYRFESGANWESADGRQFDLKLRRLVRPDPDQWRLLGYEIEHVWLRLHDGSGHLERRDRFAASGLQAYRDQPGSNPGWHPGTGEMPVVRISPHKESEPFQVTAAGELHVPEDLGSDEYGTPLTGSFILSMHCNG